mgnify:CR=1 FL=1
MFRMLAVLTISAALLTACTTSTQYGGSKKDGAFFAVPNGWREISNSALNKEEGKTKNQNDLDRLSMVTYQVGFTTSKTLTAREVFQLAPTKEPVAFARFRDLFPEERNAISFNLLRDVILPVTSYQDGTKTNDRNFQLIDDQEIVQKGGRGVNLIYSFDYNGSNETINQTAIYSNDQSKIYIFIVRCATECYNKNVKDLEKIVKSFTVRGAR